MSPIDITAEMDAYFGLVEIGREFAIQGLMRDGLDRAAAEAEWERLERRDFRFHDLRHTCASWMAMAGVPVEKIQKQLGHKDIRMTMRYMYLAPDGIRSGADQLDRWFKTEREWPPAPAAGAAEPVEACKKTTNG